MQSKNKLYYGWIITLLAGLTYFGSNGLLSISSGTIISQVLLVRGWDAAEVSFTYTLKSFLGLGLPLVGLLLMKIVPANVFSTPQPLRPFSWPPPAG